MCLQISQLDLHFKIHKEIKILVENTQNRCGPYDLPKITVTPTIGTHSEIIQE